MTAKPDWPIARFQQSRLYVPTLYRCTRCGRRTRNRTRQTFPHTWRNDRLMDWRILPDRQPVVSAKGIAVYLGLCPRCKKAAV